MAFLSAAWCMRLPACKYTSFCSCNSVSRQPCLGTGSCFTGTAHAYKLIRGFAFWNVRGFSLSFFEKRRLCEGKMCSEGYTESQLHGVSVTFSRHLWQGRADCEFFAPKSGVLETNLDLPAHFVDGDEGFIFKTGCCMRFFVAGKDRTQDFTQFLPCRVFFVVLAAPLSGAKFVTVPDWVFPLFLYTSLATVACSWCWVFWHFAEGLPGEFLARLMLFCFKTL